ncbi:MAG: glycoside hydrolase family 127 protein, partial [Clostridiales bacterium]|nr:glycoside hydrolase family 127 protein [Clostridiales bacterium]
IEKGLKQIDYVLEHADSDGYLGPEILKSDPLTDRWPHTVFFRALMAYYSATGDERVIKSLERHYLRDSCDIDVIKRHVRELTNIEPILWTYEYTGNDRLLQLALEIFQKHNDDKNIWSPRYPLALKGMLTDWQGLWYINSLENYHGVTYNEVTKIAALVYMYTGNKTFLKGSVNAYHKMMRDHMLIDGIPSSDEHFMGRDAHNYHETCVISDLTWSAGYLLMATGQAEYADMIEKACFNAAPGVIKDDFKAIQYYSSVNQVIADRTSQHTPHRFSGSWTAFRPNHYIACCNGNVHRIMPNYIARMWMKDKNEGISAMLYGPSQISEKLGKEQQNVTITEETFYPFSDTIKFTINSGIPVTFKMSLRIPGWCSKASMEINSKPLSAELKPGTLAMIEREFSDGDVIILTLPMELKVSTWPRGGIGIERGPLVYALKIEEDWQVDELAGRRGTAGYPAW